MRTVLFRLLAGLFLVGVILTPSNFIEAKGAAVHANGYFRSNGTYVAPHYRSAPDGNPYNNYSFPGNTNPFTGKTATGDPDTYLKNYYNKSSGSSMNFDNSNSAAVYQTILPTKNVSYVTKTWSSQNPNISCQDSTFLRSKEKQECVVYRANINNYSWNVTTEEFDGLHYKYNSSSGVTNSCKDGYVIGSDDKCHVETVNNALCPAGYVCTRVN